MRWFRRRSDVEYVRDLRKFYGRRKLSGILLIIAGIASIILGSRAANNSMNDSGSVREILYAIGFLHGLIGGISILVIPICLFYGFYFLIDPRKDRLLLEYFDRVESFDQSAESPVSSG